MGQQMALSERIRAVRGQTAAAEFCRVIDVHRNTLARYEAGERLPDSAFLEAVCKEFSINPEWLLTGEGPMHKQQLNSPYSQNQDKIDEQINISSPDIYSCDDGQIAIPQWKNPDPEIFDYVPMAETQLSAGGGAFVISEEIEGYYAFRKNWLSRVASSAKNLVLMRVIGDSMSPTIQQEDTVMIDIGKRSIKEGMIYAIRFDSTVMIKRLAFRPGGRILIISDNRQEYEPYEAELKDLHIIGQIIFFCRTFATE